MFGAFCQLCIFGKCSLQLGLGRATVHHRLSSPASGLSQYELHVPKMRCKMDYHS